LSLLDATTANFGLTSAIWLLARPAVPLTSIALLDHLRAAFRTTLNAYPQWCGFLKSILGVDGDSLPQETSSFPPHAKRYGRVCVLYGSAEDPGVEFVHTTSVATVDDLYSIDSAGRRPIWTRQERGAGLALLVPPTTLVNALQPNEKN
jgi:hypothetical protein